jgi:hypothetical protein
VNAWAVGCSAQVPAARGSPQMLGRQRGGVFWGLSCYEQRLTTVICGETGFFEGLPSAPCV